MWDFYWIMKRLKHFLLSWGRDAITIRLCFYSGSHDFQWDSGASRIVVRINSISLAVLRNGTLVLKWKAIRTNKSSHKLFLKNKPRFLRQSRLECIYNVFQLDTGLKFWINSIGNMPFLILIKFDELMCKFFFVALTASAHA